MPPDLAAFTARLLNQGWNQGALIPWAGELAAAIRRHGLRTVDLGLDPGRPALAVEKPDAHFVLISQLCDLVAGFEVEPFATAIPAGSWDHDASAALPQVNSSRHLVIDRSARAVASQARLISFPKRLIPDHPAKLVDVHPPLLATWCARRWRRIPLPDDFADTVVRALGHAIGQGGRRRRSRRNLVLAGRVPGQRPSRRSDRSVDRRLRFGGHPA